MKAKLKHLKLLTLSKEFEITDLKEPKRFLGIEIYINKDKGYIFLHQKLFIQSVLKQFNILECNPILTPVVTQDAERKGANRSMIDVGNIDSAQIPFG